MRTSERPDPREHVYGSRLSHIFDKPSISKSIFLIYLVYQMIYLVYQIMEADCYIFLINLVYKKKFY